MGRYDENTNKKVVFFFSSSKINKYYFIILTIISLIFLGGPFWVEISSNVMFSLKLSIEIEGNLKLIELKIQWCCCWIKWNNDCAQISCHMVEQSNILSYGRAEQTVLLLLNVMKQWHLDQTCSNRGGGGGCILLIFTIMMILLLPYLLNN